MNADPCGSGSTALIRIRLNLNLFLQNKPKPVTRMEPEPNQDWTAYTTIVTNKVRIDHRIRIDRMEKPFKVRQYVYNLL